MVQKRRTYLQNIGPKAPSIAGRPKEFRGQQANSDQLIYCNRPSHATTVIPVTLLHPVFGQFLDDKDMLEPTAPDNKLVREFSAVMAQIYDTEEERRAEILAQLRKWDIDLHGTTIEGTLYRTDADMQHKGDRYGLAEVKNEIGSKGAEPNAQAAAYYLESTRRRAVDCPKSPLPCFLLYIFGEDLQFTFPCVTQTIVVRPVYWVWWCGMEPSTHCASAFYRSAVAFPLLRWSIAEGHCTTPCCPAKSSSFSAGLLREHTTHYQ